MGVVMEDEASGVQGFLNFNEDITWGSKLSGSTKKYFWERITDCATTGFGYYVLRAEVDFLESLSHRVTRSSLLIDGELIRQPVTKFSRKRESWLSIGNC